jgi:hypothetical protein
MRKIRLSNGDKKLIKIAKELNLKVGIVIVDDTDDATKCNNGDMSKVQ